MGFLVDARERAVEAGLALGTLLCCWMLYHTAGYVIVHVLSGLAFMSVAAFSLVQGQFAKQPIKKVSWFTCTGGSLFLFLYWALVVVFRAPVIKETVGCGGVQFVHDEL